MANNINFTEICKAQVAVNDFSDWQYILFKHIKLFR